jgi:hypothetical protein
MRDDERRTVQFPDDIRNCEGLARAGDAEQRLVPIPGLDRLQELGNGLPLITARCVVRFERERHRSA